MEINPLLERALTKTIIESFYEVYSVLGFGFRERVYSLALERELVARGHRVRGEVPVPVWYKGAIITTERVDMLVEERVIVEKKSMAILPAAAEDQLLNYLKSTPLQVGLLLHFGPEPKFYRRVHTDKRHLTSNPH